MCRGAQNQRYPTLNSSPSCKLVLLFPASIRLRQLHSVLRQPSSQQTLSHTTPPPTPDLFKVTPKVSLFDQKIDIRVHGLPSKVKVTLHAVVEATWRRERVQFASCGHYVTDEHGMVDVSKDESLGGTYAGICFETRKNKVFNIFFKKSSLKYLCCFQYQKSSRHLIHDEMDFFLKTAQYYFCAFYLIF